jgi:hypothetical protein
MFLRFYNQSQEKIDECIKKLRKYANGLKQVKKSSLTQSVNIMLPEGKNTQVDFEFETAEQEENFYKNSECQKIYMEYASGNKLPCTFIPRKPKDMAFIH